MCACGPSCAEPLPETPNLADSQGFRTTVTLMRLGPAHRILTLDEVEPRSGDWPISQMKILKPQENPDLFRSREESNLQ